MYIIHSNSEKKREYTKEESLNSVMKRKIGKLITQIKTQKVIHPELDVSADVTALEKFRKGTLKGEIHGLAYEIARDDSSFFIRKIFDDTFNYHTARYYSLSKDDNYYAKKKELI